MTPAGRAHDQEVSSQVSEAAALTTEQRAGQDEQKTDLVKGMRVETPAGQATIRQVRYCDQLKRFRCSVETDAAQPDGSYWAVFDVSQVQLIEQGRPFCDEGGQLVFIQSHHQAFLISCLAHQMDHC